MRWAFWYFVFIHCRSFFKHTMENRSMFINKFAISCIILKSLFYTDWYRLFSGNGFEQFFYFKKGLSESFILKVDRAIWGKSVQSNCHKSLTELVGSQKIYFTNFCSLLFAAALQSSLISMFYEDQKPPHRTYVYGFDDRIIKKNWQFRASPCTLWKAGI